MLFRSNLVMRPRHPAVSALWMLAALYALYALSVADAPAAEDPVSPAMPIGTQPAHLTNGVDVVPLRPGLDVIEVHGQNVVVQHGQDGALVIDSGAAGDGQALIEAIGRLSAEPIRFILNTSASADCTGNNAELSRAGHGFGQTESGFTRGGRFVAMSNAPIVARLNVLTTMIGATPGYSQDALPSLTFHEGQQNLSLNGDSIEMVPALPGHSDGDSWVIFRRADVIADVPGSADARSAANHGRRVAHRVAVVILREPYIIGARH